MMKVTPIWSVVYNITNFYIRQDMYENLIYMKHISNVRLAGFGIFC